MPFLTVREALLYKPVLSASLHLILLTKDELYLTQLGPYTKLADPNITTFMQRSILMQVVVV
ncbi:hypothetical protein XS74_25040 [Salmonella enterica subsp. enterica]|nr:hypothetical protein [Salmonella enterica subsp. enterica]